MTAQEAFSKAYADREALVKELHSIELAIEGQKQKLTETRTRYSTVDKIVKASAAEMAKSTVQIGRGRPPGSKNSKVVAQAEAKTPTKADMLKQLLPTKTTKKARA